MTQSDVNQVLVESVVPVQLELAHEFEKIHKIVNLGLKVALVLAVANAAFILLLALTVNAIFAGKVVLIEVMIGFSAVCLLIVFGYARIMSLLAEAEEIAYLARDQAFVDLNMARDELTRLRRKLTREEDEEGYGGANEMLKILSPLVMMFIQKEKNIFRWGMFGWKVAQNAMAIMKQRSKNV
jgi:hypothetical protein